MAVEAEESSEIKETDIVFDCPFCGKSLAIDYRGAGLTIPCTDCGSHVEVPIPEGMELADIDSTDEEQEARIVNLRRSLASAELRITELEEALADVSSRRETLEASRLSVISRQKTIRDSVDIIQRCLRELSAAVQSLASSAEAMAPTTTAPH